MPLVQLAIFIILLCTRKRFKNKMLEVKKGKTNFGLFLVNNTSFNGNINAQLLNAFYKICQYDERQNLNSRKKKKLKLKVAM